METGKLNLKPNKKNVVVDSDLLIGKLAVILSHPAIDRKIYLLVPTLTFNRHYGVTIKILKK